MVLITVEAVAGETKPQAAVRVRIFPGERHSFSAAAPLSSRASFLEQEIAGGVVESSPKLVRQIKSGSTWAEELSPRITQTAATSSIRLRVFLSDVTSASMGRHGCRSSCSRLSACSLVFLIFSVNLSKWLSILFSFLSSLSSKCRYLSANVGRSGPNSS